MSAVLLTEGEPVFKGSRVLDLAQLSKMQSIKVAAAWDLMPRLLLDIPSVLPLAAVTHVAHRNALSIEFKQMNGLSMRDLLERHKQARQPFPEEALCSYVLQLLTALDMLERLKVSPEISLDTILVSPTTAQDPCNSSLGAEDDGMLLYGECFLTCYNPICAAEGSSWGAEPRPSPLAALAGVLNSLCQVSALSAAHGLAYSRELRAFIRACTQENSALRPTIRQSLGWFRRTKAAAPAPDPSTGIPAVLSVVPDRATRPSSPLRSVSPSRLVAHPDYTLLLASPPRLKTYLDGRPNRDLLKSLLETAVARRSTASVTIICEHLARRQMAVEIKPRDGTTVLKETPLMVAARNGDAVAVKGALEAFSDCLGSVFCGDTALRIASRRGHFAAARLLLGELGIRSPGGWTALMSAAQHGHDNLVALLLPEAGMQLENGTSALMLAGRYGHADCIQRLRKEEKRLVDKNGESIVDHVEAAFRNGTINATARRRCLDALAL